MWPEDNEVSYEEHLNKGFGQLALKIWAFA